MNKPVALSIVTTTGLPRSTGIFIPADAAGAHSDEECLRRALHALERLRAGWRPDKALLADACRAERWAATRRRETAYQFVGFASNASGTASTIIATALAVDPAARWALLFPDRWVMLGAPSETHPPLDPSDVMACAHAWLLR